jgi:hypothetical protein
MELVLEREAVGIQDPKRKREVYVEIDLTEAQKNVTIYRKTESLNPELSDTQHDTSQPWVEEFTDVPQVLKRINAKDRIFLSDEHGDRAGITEDDGYIFHYHGTYAGEKNRLLNGRIVSVEEIEENQDLNDDNTEMVTLWEFRLKKLIKTDGPARRERLQDSIEEQRARSESGLIDTIKNAFSAVALKQGSSGQDLNANTMAQNPQQAITQTLSGMSEDQREALFVQAQMMSDDEERAKKEDTDK